MELFEFSRILSALLLVLLVNRSEPRTLRKWTKTTLTWNFIDPYHLLNREKLRIVRKIVRDAFSKWAEPLEGLVRFQEIGENGEEIQADLNVFFAKKNHSCYENFDGRGGVLAHSMYPPFGVLHLDGDEEWQSGNRTKDRLDIRLVLLHEIGHTLGLRHSRRKLSVMNKYYEVSGEKFELSEYDVRAVRRLYGSTIQKIDF